MKKNWTIRLLAGVAAGAMAFSMVGCGSSKEQFQKRQARKNSL